MARRRLFSTTTRRRLFSSGALRRRLFCDHVLVCMDCGHEIKTTGATTNLVCPNCGSSNRFNYKDDDCSLYSSFYSDPCGEEGENYCTDENYFMCCDCHTKFTDPSFIPDGVVCPNCGGLRVVQLNTKEQQESDATDELLREYSEKTISQRDLQKLFAERGIRETVKSFCNSGYASLNDEGQVCFVKRGDIARKLFSEIVISVTKELRLIPTEGEGRFENLIHGLENRGNITPKGIILVKRAHGIIPPVVCQSEFSETDAYIKDSGLANDLKLEYSGQTLPLKGFMNILDTQYNDAPDDLLDKLVDTGIIKITGSQVEIL